jgi:hypothetical protein
MHVVLLMGLSVAVHRRVAEQDHSLAEVFA